MAGKKDKDETMKRLVAAVGEILKEKGYSGLGLNKIALQAGVTKELIYRYFDGFNNLLKTYISGKDYWMPILEKANIGEIKNDEDILHILIDLLQGQFRFFYEEPEMQKIILWQISEGHALLKSISEKRETEGAKLLAMTNSHFRNSNINFNAIMALLLGGIYYVVLHAETNKSTVAGIDINREKDQQEIINAIEQILTWAWEAAAEKRIEE